MEKAYAARCAVVAGHAMHGELVHLLLVAVLAQRDHARIRRVGLVQKVHKEHDGRKLAQVVDKGEVQLRDDVDDDVQNADQRAAQQDVHVVWVARPVKVARGTEERPQHNREANHT